MLRKLTMTAAVAAMFVAGTAGQAAAVHEGYFMNIDSFSQVGAATTEEVTLKITGIIGLKHGDAGERHDFEALVTYDTRLAVDGMSAEANGPSVTYPATIALTVSDGDAGTKGAVITNINSKLAFEEECCGDGGISDSLQIDDNHNGQWDGPLFGRDITHLIWSIGNADGTAFSDNFFPGETLGIDGLLYVPDIESHYAGGDDTISGTIDMGELAPTTPVVDINIKPGSDPNSINTCSGGTTPVTIFGSMDLDVATIDPTSLVLASANVKLVGKSNKILCNIEDIGSVDDALFDNLNPAADGKPDLTCHFVTFALTQLEDSSETADLTGNGCDSATPFPDCTGTPEGLFDIEGSDSVNVVKDCE